MTLEEMKAKKAELAAKLETAKLQKEIEASEVELKEIEKPSGVEVPALDDKRTAIAMKKLAEEKDFDQFTKAHADMIALGVEAKLNAWESKNAARGSIKFFDGVKKAYGKNANVLAIAQDIAPQLPQLNEIARLMQCHVSELSSFKQLFGQRDRKEVDAAVEAIELQNEFGRAVKSLTVAGSTSGAEYVPTLFSDRVFDRLVDINAVLANLPLIDLPSNPWRMPLYSAIPTAYYVTEGATCGSSDPTTGNADFDARKISARSGFSGEMLEDSIVAAMPFAERVLMETMGNAIERVVLYGDVTTTASTNINLVDGTPTTSAGSASVYLTRSGLAYSALLGSNGVKKDINSDIVAGISALMSGMGVGAVDPRQLVGFVNVNAAFSYMGSSSFITWDKMGPSATLLTGMLGSIFGMPLVPTSGLPASNTVGKVSANSLLNIYGTILLVKKTGVAVGFRRRPSIKEVTGLEGADLRSFIASVRLDPKVLQPAAADRAAVAIGYKIGLL